MLLGIDTGGTFTDFVLWDGTRLCTHKVLSSPAAPEQAILRGIAELGLLEAARSGSLAIIHGSTVATNAALQRTGARTVYVGNRGLGDLLAIGRQSRPELYALQPAPLPAPVPAELCLETGGRLAPDGSEIEPLTAADLELLRTQVAQLAPEAVAINLLYSFVDDRHERAIEAALRDLGFVCRSSQVLPEYREYERGMATWLNAWLGPTVAGYLRRLASGVSPARLAIMQSTGGTLAAEEAAAQAVRLMLSGPAGGLAGALYIGRQCGRERLLSFDMGGTSTDVAMIDGEIRLTSEGAIGPFPVAVPMVDMHSIGAGGGSIAFIDAGGMLQVGPQSTGASPGPACYGQGGRFATITDANVVLGRLPADTLLGGSMPMDATAARNALAPIASALRLGVEAAADGIIALANEHMSRALRVISAEQGRDPRDFTLCCFGGAGGLHVCDLAESLGIGEVLVPLHGGVLSALGMLVAPRERQASRTVTLPLTRAAGHAVEAALAGLRPPLQQALARDAGGLEGLVGLPSVDCRYLGQSHCINVPWLDIDSAARQFYAAHRQRFGHALDSPAEIVNVRLALRIPGAAIHLPPAPCDRRLPGRCHVAGTGVVPVWERDSFPLESPLPGPLLLRDAAAATWVKPGWQAVRLLNGCLLLTNGEGR